MLVQPICLACLILSSLVAPEVVEIKLAGPRQVRVRLVEDAGQYELTVTMLGVKAFDEAANQFINRKKARTFAVVALARHLRPEGERQVSLVMKEVVQREGKSAGSLYRSVVRVSAKNVRVVANDPAAENPADGEPGEEVFRLEISSSLLARKSDQLETLESLADFILQQSPLARADLNKVGIIEFDELVTGAGEEIDKQFKRFIKAVESDRLLLSIEKEEILNRVPETINQVGLFLIERLEEYDERTSKKEDK